MQKLSMFVGLLLFSCTQEPSATKLASSPSAWAIAPSDISIFLPVLSNNEIRDAIPYLDDTPDASGAALIPPGTFKKISKAYESRRVTFEAGRFKPVSIRIDPCSNSRDLASAVSMDQCIPQFRVVYQAIFSTSGQSPEWRAVDQNIHAIHRLTHEELTQILLKLEQLRLASAPKTATNNSLVPHPILAVEGNGPYLQGILELMNSYTGVSRLTELATMSVFDESGDLWAFAQFPVKDGVLTQNALEHVAPLENGKAPKLQDVIGSIGTFSSLSPKSTLSIMNAFTKSTPDSLYKNMLTLENPKLQSVSNTDCGSCHVAELRRLEIADGGQVTNLDVPEGYKNPRWNLGQGNKNKITIQMFGFSPLDTATVSQRVLSETAESMDWIMNNIPKPQSDR